MTSNRAVSSGDGDDKAPVRGETVDSPAPGSELQNPSVSEFRDLFARGGGLWTMKIDQFIAAFFARAAARRQVHPNKITFGSVVVTVVTSMASWSLIENDPIIGALIAAVGWQLGYILDCADGQVARANAAFSRGGAVADLLADFINKLAVSAVLVSMSTSGLDEPTDGVFAVFVTAAIIFPIFYEALPISGATESIDTVSRLRLSVRLVRDWGLQVFALPVAFLIDVQAIRLLLAAITAVNLFVLLVRAFAFMSDQSPKD